MRAILVALLLLTAACGPQAATPPAASSSGEPTPGSASSGVVAVLTGAPVVADDGTVKWCPRPGSTNCPGVAVTELSADTVEAFDDPEQMWQVEGVYDGQRLAAISPPEPVEATITDDFTTPCEDLRGKRESSGNPDGTAADAVAQYVATIPDRYAGHWWDSDNAVLTVQLTGDDVAGHQIALDEALGDSGQVCVVGGARYSLAELERAQRRAMDIAADAGMGVWGSGIDIVGNHVDLDVDYSDEPTRQRIRQDSGDAVRIHAFLALRDAALDQLPEAPQRGNVELETANQRGDGGMLALGTFTVRFDAEQRCVYGEFGSERVGLIWPFGYYATADPLQVFDADGQLVAREGDLLESGGGHVPREGPQACGTSDVWIMSGRPTQAGASEGTPR